MKRKEILFLQDILSNIDDVEKFSKGLIKEQLEKNNLKQKAIVRSLEIIGEAAKNISEQTRRKYPEVEWRNITGARDIFIHAYFTIRRFAFRKLIPTDL